MLLFGFIHIFFSLFSLKSREVMDAKGGQREELVPKQKTPTFLHFIAGHTHTIILHNKRTCKKLITNLTSWIFIAT